jgi:serine/threonine protein kinase/tetratricopeptide (TPR) repeat protein
MWDFAMADLENKAKEIFWAALDHEGELDSFVDQACDDDTQLRERVQALLQARQEAGDFLPASNVEATIDSGGPAPVEAIRSQTAAEPKPADQIGPYKLLEEIGEGGMGTVWVAKQSQPIKRKVAIKLIKAGMDSQQVLARFEAERQALAMMEHPNIARVVDAGMTEQGRPYFAMEYVKGVPLTEYCDQAKLSVKERLELFLPICTAVQHAHQKGIIHRDLKPSNILVCLYDGKPVPKVIDFGLAKAMHHSLTEQSLYTAHGMMVGTPLYMSPEQAEHNNLDIDTRTDVYALGVILYELLTGTTPLEKAQMKEAAYDEFLRLIKEVEPPKPSTRLNGSASLPSVAAQRSIDPSHLTRSIAGDLDWVVMKALEKERCRRYETANGLVEDIRRHLSDEPVSASPPSARYRMRKFIKRNRAGVIAASAIAVALLLGVVGTTSGMLWALSEKRAAVAAREAESEAKQEAIAAAKAERLAKLDAQAETKKAEVAAKKEKTAYAQAQKRLAQIEKANEILGSIFKNLNPLEIARNERPLQAILLEKLDKAVEQLEGDSIGDPLVVAKIQEQFGISLLGLGDPGKAILLYEKALATRSDTLGPEHPDTITTRLNLAAAYGEAGQWDKALPLEEQTFQLRKAKLGIEHPDTITSMNNLANAYHAVNELDKALPLYEQTLKLAEVTFGREHPHTLTTMNGLARAYQDTGQWDKALPLTEQAYQLQKAMLGPKHPNTVKGMGVLARAYQSAGQGDKATQLFEQVYQLRKTTLGPDHPDTIESMTLLARAYSLARQPDMALKLIEQVYQLRKATLEPEHPDTIASMNNLASAYNAASQGDKALPLFERTLKLAEVAFGREHPNTVVTMNNLAEAYLSAGQWDKALPLFERTLELAEVTFGREHPNTVAILNNLARAYLDAGQPDKAGPLGREALAIARKTLPSNSPQLAGILAQYGLFNIEARAYTDAETAVRECLAIREKIMADDWRLFSTLSLLGAALLGQQKYEEAEPLLLKGYEGMKERERTIPALARIRVTEAPKRLVQLHQATDNEEQSAKWQAELDKRKQLKK